MSTLAIRVTPRSSKPGLGPWRQTAEGRDELEVRVMAAPTDGEANAAVTKLVAKALGVPRRAVRIAAGETSRHKRLEIDLDAADLGARIKALI